jgi:hypothetical protein
MSEGWLDLENEETGGTTRIPDDPAVLAAHEGRGWRVVEVPDPGPFVPDKVNVDPGDVEAAWVELVHPVTGARHQFPNNPDALTGAARPGGWPRTVTAASRRPRCGRRRASKASTSTTCPPRRPTTDGDAPEEPAGGTAGAESDQPAESSATNEEE